MKTRVHSPSVQRKRLVTLTAASEDRETEAAGVGGDGHR
jgi:hypothetical protein